MGLGRMTYGALILQSGKCGLDSLAPNPNRAQLKAAALQITLVRRRGGLKALQLRVNKWTVSPVSEFAGIDAKGAILSWPPLSP